MKTCTESPNGSPAKFLISLMNQQIPVKAQKLKALEIFIANCNEQCALVQI
jgi:hypothetical protein